MFCFDLQANATAGIQSGRIYCGSLYIHTFPLGFPAYLSVCRMSASPFTDEQSIPSLLTNINLSCLLQFTVSALSLYQISSHFNTIQMIMLTLAASSLPAVKQYERSRSHMIPSGVCWPFVNWLHFHACTFNKVAKCQWLHPSTGLCTKEAE